MKNLAILLLLSTPLFSFGQQAGSPNLVASTSIQEQKSHQVEINKLEKVVARSTKSIAKMQQENKDIRRAIDYNEKQQVENVSQTALVRESMNGFDLKPLEDKIDRLEKDKRKLNSKTEQNQNAIIRKKARIEKMLSEIEMMEDQIVENDSDVVEIDANINSTQETITSNGLVEKDKNLANLEKDLKSLKKKNHRQKSRLLRNQDQINESSDKLRASKVELQNLNNDKALYESRGEIHSNKPIH